MPKTGARWRQIRDDIVAGIIDGRWPVGSPIPSYSELKERYGASVATCQRAVKSLRDAGVLRGETGVRVVVVREPSPTELGEGDGKTVEDRLAELEERAGFSEAALHDLYGKLGLPWPGEASPDRTTTRQGDVEGHGRSHRSAGAAGA